MQGAICITQGLYEPQKQADQGSRVRMQVQPSNSAKALRNEASETKRSSISTQISQVTSVWNEASIQRAKQESDSWFCLVDALPNCLPAFARCFLLVVSHCALRSLIINFAFYNPVFDWHCLIYCFCLAVWLFGQIENSSLVFLFNNLNIYTAILPCYSPSLLKVPVRNLFSIIFTSLPKNNKIENILKIIHWIS